MILGYQNNNSGRWALHFVVAGICWKSKARKLRQPVTTEKSAAEATSWPLGAEQKASSKPGLPLGSRTSERQPANASLA